MRSRPGGRRSSEWRAQGLPASTTASRRSSSRSSCSRSCTRSPRATRSSPPTSASTRCGRRSSTSSTSRGAGSTRAASARWASACRRRWACRWRNPGATVACVTGEASIQMCIQELSTCKQYRLPIKIMNLNNRYMGMVRQWQQFFHGNRYSESYMDALPDFVKLAEAYGHVGMQIEKPGDVEPRAARGVRAQERARVPRLHHRPDRERLPDDPGRQGHHRDDPRPRSCEPCGTSSRSSSRTRRARCRASRACSRRAATTSNR